MPKQTTLLLDHILPGDSVKLGRLVLNIQYPEEDFYELEHPSPLGKVTTQSLETFSYSKEHTNAIGFEAFLTNLISAASGIEDSTAVSVSSASCTTRQLQDSGGFFTKLCEVDTARLWLERAFRRRDDVYLVTGIKTLIDPSVSLSKSKTRDGSVSVQLPVTFAATTAAGVPIPVSGILDPGVGGNISSKSGEKVSFVAPGEQIFAIQYRKVYFNWFSRKKVENTRLKAGNQWETYLGTRGGDKDTEDVVEAQLSEYLQEDDFDGEEYEYFVIGDEEYFYPGMW
ncbi:hypothetical protein BFW01_g8976 [Lasiodiplodia theobromae]|uniref:Uncharacterized protein n=1 Tax=Lasiodiplodia theobromae TaxID=45133 RepID=A0A5N5D4H0_9PEZI|nr:hypothetical protein DBV05_g8842 [Lasiodiplodia theobromae]KAF9638079.1 hypothetical protein BFW01_g8976 [Lasiodiplodia theobromae]